MKRILAGIDFSPHAQRALDWAAAFARLYGAELELLTSGFQASAPAGPEGPVVAPQAVELALAQDREQLSELANELGASGLAASAFVSLEPPARALCARAKRQQVDLITVGTRGRTGLAHVVFGSTAERTLHGAPCPVLTAHADSPPPPDLRARGTLGRVLVATDFSAHAKQALQWARALAAKTHAKLLLLHVCGENAPEVERVALANRLEHLAAPDGADHELRSGRADEEILSSAAAHGAALIAVGARGHTGLAHVLLGSTAERVLRRAAPPVVTVRAPAADEAGRQAAPRPAPFESPL